MLIFFTFIECVSSKSPLIVSFGHFMYGLMLSSNNNNLFFHFLFVFPFPFISFSCLIFLAETFTILHKDSVSEHPQLVPDLRGNAFTFFHYDVVCDVSHIAFIMYRNVPSIWNLFKVLL